jgi:HSP20 family molecular chaperone IbpA
VTEDLDLGNVTATLRDGVLRVEIPRSAKVQPKKIPVRAE